MIAELSLRQMIAKLLLPERGLRFLWDESLLFPFWAFTSHVALLVASETSAFSFETLLVFFCEGASDLCEDRLIYIHRDCSIIRVLRCARVGPTDQTDRIFDPRL